MSGAIAGVLGGGGYGFGKDSPMRPRVAVILPCYKTRDRVLSVIAAADSADLIICVDDCCPEQTGKHIRQTVTDPRVIVLIHEKNQGVGGAVCTGYRKALEWGAEVCVKIDSDGQMDPADMDLLVDPVLAGDADYAKGNRFYNIEDVAAMPLLRLVGNAGLSFLTKLASGYWRIFDPTNGYTAIHARVLERLPLHKLAKRYFFESDLLFRLGTIRARVIDVPMQAFYGEEVSNLRVSAVAPHFLFGNLRNFFKRIFYCYFLRDFSAASLYILLGAGLTGLGVWNALYFWWLSNHEGVLASAGNVMLASMPIILGVQFWIAFLHYDAETAPPVALHPMLRPLKSERREDLAVVRDWKRSEG